MNCKNYSHSDLCRILEDKQLEISNLTSELDNQKKYIQAILQEREGWHKVFQNIAIPTMILDTDYVIRHVNDATLEAFKCDRNDFIGKKCYQIFHNGSTAENCPLQESVEKQNSVFHEIFISALDGEFLVACRPIPGDNGKIEQILHIATDISTNKKIQQKLYESEHKFRSFFNTVNDVLLVHYIDKKGVFSNFIEANENACSVLGYTKKELLKLCPKDIVDSSSNSLANPGDFKDLLVEDGKAVFERIFVTKEGQRIPVEISSHRFSMDGKAVILSVARNIKERKLAEKKLYDQVKEKEVLLKEIHHRVKNNLQIISSLLGLQSQYINDKNMLSVFKESQARIRSMALVHENLYQSQDLAHINLGKYIIKLVSDLYHTYNINYRVINIKTDLQDIFLNIEYAIPCGLIINELVSNSLKYAFPDTFQGDCYISIILKEIDDKIEIVVQDNGVGFPQNIDLHNAPSLGLHLVSILAEEQLDGRVVLEKGTGTKFTIDFQCCHETGQDEK